MRYRASEKLEIIRTVEASASADQANPEGARHPQQHLLRLVRALGGGWALMPWRIVPPDPGPVWNRIPDDVRDAFIGFCA